MELKVYVWPQFEESIAEYTGLAVAIAYTLDDAISLVEADTLCNYNQRRWGDVEVYEVRQLACVCRGSG